MGLSSNFYRSNAIIIDKIAITDKKIIKSELGKVENTKL
jgi:hypothetical protein